MTRTIKDRAKDMGLRYYSRSYMVNCRWVKIKRWEIDGLTYIEKKSGGKYELKYDYDRTVKSFDTIEEALTWHLMRV